MYLIVVDHYSKFIAVEPVADHSAKKTIIAFLQIFSKLGIPPTIHCNNGATFTSETFIAFCFKSRQFLYLTAVAFIIAQTQLNKLLDLQRTS